MAMFRIFLNCIKHFYYQGYDKIGSVLVRPPDEQNALDKRNIDLSDRKTYNNRMLTGIIRQTDTSIITQLYTSLQMTSHLNNFDKDMAIRQTRGGIKPIQLDRNILLFRKK